MNSMTGSLGDSLKNNLQGVDVQQLIAQAETLFVEAGKAKARANALDEKRKRVKSTIYVQFRNLGKSQADYEHLAVADNRPGAGSREGYHEFVEESFAQWDRHFRDKFEDGKLPGTVVFESNIEKARMFYEHAKAEGVKVALVHSNAARENDPDSFENATKAVDAYSAGRYDMLVSVKKLDEGIDAPRTRCVLLNRRTTSSVEYHQMAGRAMRMTARACANTPASCPVQILIDSLLDTPQPGPEPDHEHLTAFAKTCVDGSRGLNLVRALIRYETANDPEFQQKLQAAAKLIAGQLCPSMRDKEDQVFARLTTWYREQYLAAVRQNVPDLKKAIQALIAPDKLALARRLGNCTGYRTINIEDYNYVATNWDQTFAEDDRPVTLNDLAATHFGGLCALQHSHRQHPEYQGPWLRNPDSTIWSEEYGFMLRVHLEDMPSDFRRVGIQPRVWRAITRATPKTSAAIAIAAYAAYEDMTFFEEGEEECEALNSLALMNPERWPDSSVSPMLKAIRLGGEKTGLAIAKAFGKVVTQDNLLLWQIHVYEIGDMLEALRAEHRILPANITMSGLVALSDEWHEWVRDNDSRTKRYSWKPLLGNRTLRKIAITELTDSDTLNAEGKRMQHCVRRYDWACAKGGSRIFHLQNADGCRFPLRFDPGFSSRSDPGCW